MPDNRSPGKLEDFARRLVRSGDEGLWDYAGQAASGSSSQGAKFAPKDQVKAHVHTFLAWQDVPGVPMGLAITKTIPRRSLTGCPELHCLAATPLRVRQPLTQPLSWGRADRRGLPLESAPPVAYKRKSGRRRRACSYQPEEFSHDRSDSRIEGVRHAGRGRVGRGRRPRRSGLAGPGSGPDGHGPLPRGQPRRDPGRHRAQDGVSPRHSRAPAPPRGRRTGCPRRHLRARWQDVLRHGLQGCARRPRHGLLARR